MLSSLLFVAACSPKTEYTHALPKNASVVVAMELNEMVEKAGLNGASGQQAVSKLKALVKGGLQGEAAQLAERIIDQPSESGLSFDDKVYLFVGNRNVLCCIIVGCADVSVVVFQCAERRSCKL